MNGRHLDADELERRQREYGDVVLAEPGDPHRHPRAPQVRIKHDAEGTPTLTLLVGGPPAGDVVAWQITTEPGQPPVDMRELFGLL